MQWYFDAWVCKSQAFTLFQFFVLKDSQSVPSWVIFFSVIQRNSVYIIVIGIGYLNLGSINFWKYTMLKTQIFHIHLKFIKIWVKRMCDCRLIRIRELRNFTSSSRTWSRPPGVLSADLSAENKNYVDKFKYLNILIFFYVLLTNVFFSLLSCIMSNTYIYNLSN